MKFNPCTGNCTEEGTHCEGCGRNHVEIAEARQIVKGVVSFVQKMEYENPEDFLNSISNKALYKLQQA